jgi:hypothetical protein
MTLSHAQRRQLAAIATKMAVAVSATKMPVRSFKPTNQWKYSFVPTVQRIRRKRGKPRTPAPKCCSYCGGKIGQGFKQITIPRLIQVRICAACLLKAYNWVFSQIEKGKNGTEGT